MQFDFRFEREPRPTPDRNWLLVGARHVPLQFVKHRRARRYVLRLSQDGSARVTIPRGGTTAEAMRFAQKNAAWLERQLLRQAFRAVQPQEWMDGARILFRGELQTLKAELLGNSTLVRFGTEAIQVRGEVTDLRPAVERWLWKLGAKELPRRVFELAALHGLSVKRVTVRNQRSRWGSCSRRGAISLNWRLIQTPAFVLDYIVLHELAHLREMNHSRRFWEVVSAFCPGFAEAEKWLKDHRELLR